MKSSRFQSIAPYLPPSLLVAVLLGVYFRAMAPGLSWAHGGSDGGDLIAAAATGGVAHPTGYPLYLLLARLFQLLPLGSLAFRTNLMSALAMTAAAALVYELVTRHSAGSGAAPNWSAGLAAGLAFGLAPVIWAQALITEVYALQALLVVTILYLYTQPVDPASRSEWARLSRWRGLALGLALGNHLTTLFLVPLALLFGAIRDRSGRDGLPGSPPKRLAHLELDGGALVQQLVGLGLGLSVLLLIPLSALADPPVNWGNAVTLPRFWWLVSGSLYQSDYLQFSLAGSWERLQTWAALLLEQFGVPGLLLSLSGLAAYGLRSRLYLLTAWMAALSLAFAAVYRPADSYVYLIPLFIACAIWLGLGLAGLVREYLPGHATLGLGVCLLVAAYILGRAALYAGVVDASGDRRAETFGREVFSAVPEDALLFAEGDQAIFALWYFHFALGERPDLAVMASDLLHFDWYQETLQTTYPSLVLPGPFPWPESVAAANPARPACFVRYVDQTEIECAEPLTTR